MEDNSHIVKALEKVLDASDAALRLAEASVSASKNALAQAKLLSDSIGEFDTESLRCDNCHALECRGRF